MDQQSQQPMNAASTPAPATRELLVRISLPDDLANHFEGMAVIHGTDLERELVDHLRRTRDHTSTAGIYLNDRDAHTIRELLGGRVSSASKLIDMLRRLVTWKIGGYKIELSPARIEAIHFYIRSLQQPPDTAIPFICDQALGMLLKC